MPERLTVFLIVDNAPDAENDFYALPDRVEREGEKEVWHGEEGRWLPLDPDWRERRREVTVGVRDLLGPADHFLPVVARPLPDDTLDGVPLGWKLPH